MLTYKIPTNKILKQEEILEGIGEIEEVDEELHIKFNPEKIVLREGDEIIFRRFELPDVAFQESRIIKKIISGDTFVVDSFPKQTLSVDSVSTIYFYPYPGATEVADFLSIHLSENHNIVSHRDKYISESINAPYKPEKVSKDAKRCPGDNVRYESLFLFVAEDVDEEGNYYIFGTERDNTKQGIYYSGELEGFLANAFAPLNEKGGDDRRWILCEITDDTKDAWEIAEKWQILSFKAEDERFIIKGEYTPESGFSCNLVSGTTISKVGMSVCLDGLITENFETDLYQEDNILNTFVEETKAKSKNRILDYEKQRFIPVDVDGDDFSELQFKIFFRSREGDYDDWRASGDEWNFEKEGGNPEGGDMLGYLGFNDNDVYYRKKKLEKSFLRLSFYDTQYRTDQALLYTSTIFIDSSKLFAKYVQAIKNGVIPIDAEEGGYVFTPETDLRCNFSVKDKFDKMSSSEGFYLYMFPAFVGETGSTIYMKAEFYHAKYGYVIPLVFWDELKASRTYWDGAKVDMGQLFSDMYIPIDVYKENGVYRWKLPYEQENNIISINLFEPKVN